MNTKLPLLSAQMLAVLRLLDCESLTARQVNDWLYRTDSPQSRRVFAASMSRTIRRLVRRGLIYREGDAMVITLCGRFRIHPEMPQIITDAVCEAIRQAVAQAFAECEESQESKGEMREDAALDAAVPTDPWWARTVAMTSHGGQL